MQGRYKKRYILPIILILAAFICDFLYNCRFFDGINNVGKLIASTLELMVRNYWAELFGLLFLILYCFLNHKLLGKIFAFAGLGLLMIHYLYKDVIQWVVAIIRNPSIISGPAAGSTRLYVEMFSFTFCLLAALLVMILHRAKPGLIKMFVCLALLQLSGSIYILPKLNWLILILTRDLPGITVGEYLVQYMAVLLLLFACMLLVLFDFLTRPKKPLTAEERLKVLKEQYENGRIDETEYEIQRTEILQQI